MRFVCVDCVFRLDGDLLYDSVLLIASARSNVPPKSRIAECANMTLYIFECIQFYVTLDSDSTA